MYGYRAEGSEHALQLCWGQVLIDQQSHTHLQLLHLWLQPVNGTGTGRETLWLGAPWEQEREGFQVHFKVHGTVSYTGYKKSPVSKMKSVTCLCFLTDGMRSIRHILFWCDNLAEAYNSVFTQSTWHAESRTRRLFVDVAWDQYNDQRFRGSKDRAWLSNIHTIPISHTLHKKWTRLWRQVGMASVGLPLTSTKEPHFSEIATVAQGNLPLLLTLTSGNFWLSRSYNQDYHDLPRSKNIHSFIQAQFSSPYSVPGKRWSQHLKSNTWELHTGLPTTTHTYKCSGFAKWFLISQRKSPC